MALFYAACQQTNNAIVETLRRAFARSQDYYWTDNIDNTKLAIYTEYPYTPARFPSIIVETTSGDTLLRRIGGDYETETTTETLVNGVTHNFVTEITYSGGFYLNTDIVVITRDSVTRDDLMDQVIMNLRYFFNTELIALGINITDMRIAGRDERPYGYDYAYRGRISITSYGDFEHTVPVATPETLLKVGITYIGTLLNNGATQGESIAQYLADNSDVF